MSRRWFQTGAVVILALAILVTKGADAQDSLSFSAEQETQLHALLSEMEVEGGGIVMWIDTRDGQYTDARGYASLIDQIPMTPDAAFRIASNTKTFVAATMLILQEQGLLHLDDPLSLYLPDMTAQLYNGDRITLRQLLNHTSGVSNYSTNRGDLRFLMLENNARFWQPAEIVSLVVNQEFSSLFTPGMGWSYSNTNYILAGMVIERVTGRPLASQIRQYILEPLGLEHTYFADAERATAPLVDNYTNLTGTPGPFEYNASSFWAAGAMVSTAPDMIAFVRAIYRGQLFASFQSLQQMLTFVPTGEGERAYGLGIDRFSKEVLVYGHTGVLPGFLTIEAYAPGIDTVVVLLANSDFGTSEYDMRVLMTRVLQVLGLTDLELPIRPVRGSR